MSLSDTELVVRAQRGDTAAFEQLVYRHDKKVLSLAARYVSCADDAKDIYQEVFLKVYRGIQKFRFKSEFSTWLHRITINVCLTHRSRERHSVHTSLDEGIEADIDENHPVNLAREPAKSPDLLTIDADVASHVQKALETLSPRQRMVFTLRHFEGYKLQEIATMMQCMEGTVKRYLFTATAKMRDQLRHIL